MTKDVDVLFSFVHDNSSFYHVGHETMLEALNRVDDVNVSCSVNAVISNGTTISLVFISPLTAHSEVFFESRRKSNRHFSIKTGLWIIFLVFTD